MSCRECYALEAEVHSPSGVDEVLCVKCKAHYYKSTTHTGPWNVYVVTNCPDCRTGLSFVNTDDGEEHTYNCFNCKQKYKWTRTTNWEFDNLSTVYKIENPTKQETYEHSYWKFMESEVGSDADTYWYNQMMAQVSLDLEPAQSWSWVNDKEPPQRKVDYLDRLLQGMQVLLFVTMFIIMPILCGLGVIK